MTYQQAAQMSIDCQDASNLSGVVRSFANEVIPAIWAEADRLGHGTDWVNQHPIVTLFLDKLASLNRTQSGSFENYCKASDEVEKIAAGEASTS